MNGVLHFILLTNDGILPGCGLLVLACIEYVWGLCMLRDLSLGCLYSGIAFAL